METKFRKFKQNSKNILKDIKSKYILEYILSFIDKIKLLDMIKYNNEMKNILNIKLDDYITYSKIIILIIPVKDNFGEFINIKNKEEEDYFHIYFNESLLETKKISRDINDNTSKIKIKIDHQVKSLDELFNNCDSIESINFINFYRRIVNAKNMFHGCLSLKKLNLSNFVTDKVQDMSFMFYNCSSLEILNLHKFNTNKVKNMSYMFCNCTTLKELNLSNFKTINITNLSHMFSSCKSLKKLDLSSFNTKNVTDMSFLFYDCCSLIELNISNFKFDKVTNMNHMFSLCKSLKKLNLYDFKMDKDISMNCLFLNCSSLKELNFYYHNIKEIEFKKNINKFLKLKELIPSSFSDCKYNDINNIFSGCRGDLKIVFKANKGKFEKNFTLNKII